MAGIDVLLSRLPVYILAGGRSSRFGADKARAEFRDIPLILHVKQLLEPIASRLTVVADRAERYADLHLRTIADHTPGCGPLGGLVTALTDLTGDEKLLLLCSCDVVVLRPQWLQMLITHGGASDAVAFRAASTSASPAVAQWEPMPALYAGIVLPAVRQQLEADELSLQRLLSRINTRSVARPHDWPDVWQINTRDDLRRLL